MQSEKGACVKTKQSRQNKADKTKQNKAEQEGKKQQPLFISRKDDTFDCIANGIHIFHKGNAANAWKHVRHMAFYFLEKPRGN
jgi:hypothetical protein